MVRRKITFLAVMLALSFGVLATLGATPHQGKPPQPFGPDSFSGKVTVQDSPAPQGMELFACIDDCGVFRSATVGIGPGGTYSQLVVNPLDRSLVGHPILFYLINVFGRIQAVEAADFQGATDGFTLDLSFDDPVPSPTPTPTVTPTASLPVPGDPTVTAIPRVALVAGVAAALGGIVLLVVVRRRIN